MKHRTEELTGGLLDAAVAKAQGWCRGEGDDQPFWMDPSRGAGFVAEGVDLYSPSSRWEDAGPMIHSENIGISPPTSRVHRNGGNQPGWGPSGYWSATTWHAGVDGKRAIAMHETSPLIAAMRCYVMSKLGEEVEL